MHQLADIAPSMKFPLTICVVVYGPHADLAENFIKQLYDNTDPALFKLRVGMNEAEPRTHRIVNEAAERYGNIQTFVEPVNIYKDPLMRKMFYDQPLDTEWVIWFDDDSYPTRPDWLQRLSIRIEREPEVAQWGKTFYVEFDDGDPLVGFVASAEWARGFPLAPGVSPADGKKYRIDFVGGGFWAVRTKTIHRFNWPDPRILQAAEDVLLGEALRQNGLEPRTFTYGVVVNGAERRNPEGEGFHALLNVEP